MFSSIPECSRTLAPGVIVAHVRYPAAVTQPAHRDACYQVSVVLAGGVRETTTFGDRVVQPLDVLCKAVNLPHADVFANVPSRLLSFRLTPWLFADNDMMIAHIPTVEWRCGQAPPTLLRHLLLAGHALADPAEMIDPELLTLDLRTLLIGDVQPTASPPKWLLRLRDHLTEHFRARVSLHAIAHEGGVHPVTFSQQFRRYFGETPTQYLVRLRIRDVADNIAHRGLSGAAYHAGFADQSHCARHFRKLTGMTLGQYRALSRLSASTSKSA